MRARKKHFLKPAGVVTKIPLKLRLVQFDWGPGGSETHPLSLLLIAGERRVPLFVLSKLGFLVGRLGAEVEKVLKVPSPRCGKYGSCKNVANAAKMCPKNAACHGQGWKVEKF